MCSVPMGEGDADGPGVVGDVRCRCSQGQLRSSPRAGSDSDSASDPGLSHCSLPAQGNFPGGVREVGDGSVTLDLSPLPGQAAGSGLLCLDLTPPRGPGARGCAWDVSGQGTDPPAELSEAGYRHTCTHVVLKTEYVSKAAV